MTPGGTPAWQRIERNAWEVGAGLAGPLDDLDLDDAIRLGSADQVGSTWWRPSSLDDLYALPERVLLLMDAFRLGSAAAAVPWRWWTATSDGPYDPAATRSHLYRVGWEDPHMTPARCGHAPRPDAAWSADGAEPGAPCRRCSGEQEQQGSGVIGGIDVRTRERVEG